MGEANINKGDEMWDDERVKEEIKLGRLLVILDENVYDCSRFANIHPGGRNYIEQYCGRQMHNVMYNGPHEHSFNAYQLMKDYYCGKLAKTSRYLPLQKKKDVDKMTVDNTSQQTCSSEIDWSKPVLWQVYKLGANYNQWVHTPVDKPLRLFKSDFAEFFSKTPWFVIPIFWIPVILFASFRSILTFTESTPQWSGKFTNLPNY
ncbi:fatty acid 2-hydroxylase-like [Antedon mediterranea]|uniref:fatty acid 2-hydroxylase-like n=1 Tax=Antedon mediterranea TaxID=105859 RepID=UPI003AF5F67F